MKLDQYIHSLKNNNETLHSYFYKDQINHYTYQNFLDLVDTLEPKNVISDESPIMAFAFLIKSLLLNKAPLLISPTQLSNNFVFPNESTSTTTSHFYLMSSGSTGHPKNIALTFDNIFTSAKNSISKFDMKPNDKTLLNLSHFHVGGLMMIWRSFLSAGCLLDKNVDNEIYQYTSLVPLQLKRILDNPSKLLTLKKCKAILIGGGIIDLPLIQIASQHNLPLFETYGMTETSSMVLCNGRPMEGMDVKIDEKTKHIKIKGPTLSPTVTVDEEGFYHTKDVGKKTSDGRILFVSRSDFLFKSAGVLINPLEIENIIHSQTGYDKIFSISIPHYTWDEAHVLLSLEDPPLNCDEEFPKIKKILPPKMAPKFFWQIPSEFIQSGIKPSRYLMKRWATENWLSSLINFKVINSKKKSSKLLVVFHGFMEDMDDWIFLKDQLNDYSLLFVDLPGHGRSHINNFTNTEEIYFYLIALIKSVQVSYTELTLFGYSMGGRMALELLIRGLKINHLILDSAFLGLNSQNEKDMRLTQDKNLFNDYSTNPKAFFDRWYSQPLFHDYKNDSHYLSDIEKKLNLGKIEEWKKSLEFFSSGKSLFNLNHILEIFEKNSEMKVDLIVGTEDKKYLEHYETLNTNRVIIHKITGAGHKLHVTHKKLFCQLIKKLLDQL